jgi:hypothetical protein
MTLVSITRLRVRSLRYLPAFLLGSLRSARAAKNASGNLAVSLLSDAHLAFWTCTLWTDERAMRGFMLAPAHRAVMPKLLQWLRRGGGNPLAAGDARTAAVAGGPSPPATGGTNLQGRSPIGRAAAV